jgi:hypothetical protein
MIYYNPAQSDVGTAVNVLPELFNTRRVEAQAT